MAQGEPLPSWNEGASKQAILDFVAVVTEEGGAQFVPEDARIATFDNDGTLWTEQPMYAQAFFILHQAWNDIIRSPARTDTRKEKQVTHFAGMGIGTEWLSGLVGGNWGVVFLQGCLKFKVQGLMFVRSDSSILEFQSSRDHKFTSCLMSKV